MLARSSEKESPTLTTVVVFMPLIFSEGLVGVLFKQLGAVVSITLLVSLAISLTLSPMIASIIISPSSANKKKFALQNKVESSIEKATQQISNFLFKVLEYALNHRKKTVIVAVVIFVISIGLFKFIGTEFFPELDTGFLQATIFIIMFSVPFALVGVLWGLFLTGQTLNVASFIGLVMLVGVVNNAIVFIDYTIRLRAKNMSVRESLMEAARVRLRPILMTTITTIFGMLPLALSRGIGSETWRPLAVAVIGGLSLSPLITLVFVPVLYSIFEERIKRF